MTQYQKYGRPGWQARSGHQATLEKSRRESLVRNGLASKWAPLRNVEDTIKAAGLP